MRYISLSRAIRREQLLPEQLIFTVTTIGLEACLSQLKLYWKIKHYL